jgi:hypothetical protein
MEGFDKHFLKKISVTSSESDEPVRRRRARSSTSQAAPASTSRISVARGRDAPSQSRNTDDGKQTGQRTKSVLDEKCQFSFFPYFTYWSSRFRLRLPTERSRPSTITPQDKSHEIHPAPQAPRPHTIADVTADTYDIVFTYTADSDSPTTCGSSSTAPSSAPSPTSTSPTRTGASSPPPQFQASRSPAANATEKQISISAPPGRDRGKTEMKLA